MAAFKLIDSQLYADNGDGSYSGVKWCDLQSATIKCKCNEADGEKFKQMFLGENHYKEKSHMEPLSYEYISDYIYNLLTSYNQDLSEFDVAIEIEKFDYNCDGYDVIVNLFHPKSDKYNSCKFTVFYGTTAIAPVIADNLNKLVKELITTIELVKRKDKTMPNYNACGKIEVIKTQEEIELEEKIDKIRSEAAKKIAKLREEFKTAQEKKARDAKAKELHDKYQSLVDAGFSAEQAYDILQTKMKLDEF